jgi:hypothetical protein
VVRHVAQPKNNTAAIRHPMNMGLLNKKLVRQSPNRFGVVFLL